MAPDPDPYRTLGLVRGASPAEIRQAYRRLAKIHHPDAAGESALPRFLAIQAAYERLIGGLDASTGGRRPPTTPRRPWEADPDRSDATRRAYGGRGRGAPPGGATGSAGSDASGTSPGPGRGPARGRSARSGRRRSEPPGTGARRPDDPAGGTPDVAPSKATLGSTSYDGADAGPFEPDWGGASWYGTTSGTYWTINPKEYADPRKHGPEYQARARRAASTRASDRTAAPSDGRTPGPSSDPGPEPTVAPTHTTSSWWDSTAGPAVAGDPTGPGSKAGTGPSPRPTTARPPTAQVVPPLDLGRVASDLVRGLFDERVGGLPTRLGRAVIAWLPIAIGLGWFAGELTGCGRFAATCDGSADAVVLLLQVAVLAVLFLVPPIAAVAAVASVAALVAAVGATLILSASVEAPGQDSSASALGAILVMAWLGGIAIAVIRRVRALGTPGSPVS